MERAQSKAEVAVNQHVPLPAQAAQYIRLRQELVEVYGLDEEDPALLDTLDGQSDFTDVLAAMFRRAEELESHAASLDAQAKERRDRADIKRDRAAKLKRTIVHYMDAAGLPRLERPEFMISVAWSRRSIIVPDDVSALPPQYVREKIIRTPDKEALKQALETGEVIEGVSLSNAHRTLRRR